MPKTQKKRTVKMARLKILKDKHGNYIIIKGKKYRLGKLVTKKAVAKFVLSKLRPSQAKTTQAKAKRVRAPARTHYVRPPNQLPLLAPPITKTVIPVKEQFLVNEENVKRAIEQQKKRALVLEGKLAEDFSSEKELLKTIDEKIGVQTRIQTEKERTEKQEKKQEEYKQGLLQAFELRLRDVALDRLAKLVALKRNGKDYEDVLKAFPGQQFTRLLDDLIGYDQKEVIFALYPELRSNLTGYLDQIAVENDPEYDAASDLEEERKEERKEKRKKRKEPIKPVYTQEDIDNAVIIEDSDTEESVEERKQIARARIIANRKAKQAEVAVETKRDANRGRIHAEEIKQKIKQKNTPQKNTPQKTNQKRLPPTKQAAKTIADIAAKRESRQKEAEPTQNEELERLLSSGDLDELKHVKKLVELVYRKGKLSKEDVQSNFGGLAFGGLTQELVNHPYYTHVISDYLPKVLLDKVADFGGGFDPKKGLSNLQIDEIMAPYGSLYLGCVAHDEIPKIIIPKVNELSRGGFVINTQPSNKNGEHWQSVFFDARPKGGNEIDFYDSYGDPIDAKMQRDLKLLSEKLNANTYLKFKENRVRKQSDHSSNCGFFATKFLIDRFRNKPFIDASGWKDIHGGEKDIEKFKEQQGFGYMPSFGRGIGGDIYDAVVEHVKENFVFRKDYPPAVRDKIESLKDQLITSLKICRMPIEKGIDTLINFISLGQFSKAKKDLGYDDMFHLYLNINGKYRFERNHVVEFYDNSNLGREHLEVSLLDSNGKFKPISIGEFCSNVAQKIGPALQKYDASTNNCQVFVRDCLKTNGLLKDEYNVFIMQKAVELLSKIPSFSQKIVKFLPDFAGKLDRLVFGKSLSENKKYMLRLIKRKNGTKRIIA